MEYVDSLSIMKIFIDIYGYTQIFTGQDKLYLIMEYVDGLSVMEMFDSLNHGEGALLLAPSNSGPLNSNPPTSSSLTSTVPTSGLTTANSRCLWPL